MRNQLSEGHKNRLKQSIIQGAENYERYLRDKCFKVVCEDGTHTLVRFFHGDFKHLSGIQSDLNENDFYTKCIRREISTGNILTDQKYDWSTLKGKSSRLENIHEILYLETEKRLLLNELKTNTYIFPVAIRNEEINSCVGFVSETHKARSLRKASSSNIFSNSKKIIAILSRQNSSALFCEIVYVKSNCDVLGVCPALSLEISEDVKMQLLAKFAEK